MEIDKSQRNVSDSTDKMFVIRGTNEQIQYAQQLIYEKITGVIKRKQNINNNKISKKIKFRFKVLSHQLVSLTTMSYLKLIMDMIMATEVHLNNGQLHFNHGLLKLLQIQNLPPIQMQRHGQLITNNTMDKSEGQLKQNLLHREQHQLCNHQ